MAESESQFKLLGKYFVHGALFAVLGLVLSFVWAVILIMLVLIGFIIGLLIGMIMLFFIVSWLNSILTSFVWHIQVKTDWKTSLVHGLVLSIFFIIVHIPSIVINLTATSVITVVPLLLIYAFVDGFLARHIAGMWQREETPLEMVEQTPKGFLKLCVECGRDIPIASETCPLCGAEQNKSNLESVS